MRTTPLSRRILLVTLAGGVIVAAVAMALSVPLVRSVAREQARVQLVRSVETLAAKPAATARLLAKEQQVVGPDDRRFAVVRPGGRVTGAAADELSQEQIAGLLSNGSLSTSTTVDGVEVLIEGRMTKRGFAAVGVQPVAGVDQATGDLTRRLILALLVGLAAAGTLGLVLSRTLTSSVTQAAGVARRLAAGERGIPVTQSSVSEIADMSSAISSLDAALAASEDRQREFLLSVSHEMRTPLTALRGYAEAMAEGAIVAEDVRATGEILSAETLRMERFVSDLLALARLEADDFSIEPVDVALGSLLADLAAAWRATCDREDVAMRMDGPSATVRADPMRLRQLLDGLVENALRATPAGGEVVVRTSVTLDQITVEVQDSGPGLDADDLTSAFDRGVLHGKYRELRPVGTGLGLSIARRLAERMGMSLEARSSPDGGAMFGVRLPGGVDVPRSGPLPSKP